MGGTSKLAGVAAAALLLSSCIGVDSRVAFKSDGSGTLKVEYRIAKSLWNLGKEGGAQLPLVVGEQELREALSQGNGLEVVAVSRREDETDVFVAAEVRFQRIEALAETEAFADMPMSLQRSGDDYVFRQVISPAAEEQPAAGQPTAPAGAQAAAAADRDVEEMFGPLLAGYEVLLSVAAPRPLKSHSAGQVSADRKSVTWRLSLDGLMEIPAGTVFTVTW